MPDSKLPRAKAPAEVAVIDPVHCTGCAACLEVCPVDCIEMVRAAEPAPNAGPGAPGLGSVCRVDYDRCIGCRLCIRLARHKSDPYELVVCPWQAIEMVPYRAASEPGADTRCS